MATHICIAKGIGASKHSVGYCSFIEFGKDGGLALCLPYRVARDGSK
jgi:hypothetical protein